jgi:Tfp pilus assembly protein PilN
MGLLINLIPNKSKKNQTSTKAYTFTIMIGIAILVLTLTYATMLYVQNKSLQKNFEVSAENLAKTESKLKTLSDIEKPLINIQDRLSIIKQLEENGVDWNGIIKSIGDTLPQEDKITSITASSLEDRKVTISGSAKTRRDAIRFYEKLKTNQNFSDTNLESLNASGEDTFSFTIQTKIVKIDRKTDE